MSTVVVSGKDLYCSTSPEDGSKVKGIVPSRPFLEVAAKDTLLDLRSGIRNSDAQPAPRIRNSTRAVDDRDIVVGRRRGFTLIVFTLIQGHGSGVLQSTIRDNG